MFYSLQPCKHQRMTFADSAGVFPLSKMPLVGDNYALLVELSTGYLLRNNCDGKIVHYYLEFGVLGVFDFVFRR